MTVDGGPAGIPAEQRANVQLAKRFVDLSQRETGLSLAAAIVLEVAGAPALQDPPRLSSVSLEQTLAGLGVTLAANDAQRLQSLPPLVRAALADLVTAFVHYQGTAQSLEPWLWHGSPDPAEVAPVRLAQVGMLKAAAGLADALASDPMRLQGPPILLPPILALDLAGEDNVYTDDFALLIDFGGNDVYLNNAGGSSSLGGVLGTCPPGANAHPGSAALFDFAGDDQYVSGRSCGVNGGAVYGAGFLLDASGMDTYWGGGSGVNGGGGFGVGLLVDLDGDDDYTADGGAVNGGGSIGSGLLIDLSGNDAYSGTRAGVNGGANLGVGFLIDAAGNDRYSATDLGVNGGSHGSYGTLPAAARGFLADLDGNDSYVAGSWGVNGGSHTGLGFLYDGGGNDLYAADHGGANGEAEPLLSCYIGCYYNHASGLLMDVKGRDSYFDNVGGTGLDKTVMPKGLVGAQIDAPG